MNGYVALGYGVTLLTLAAYAWRVAARGRALRRSLPVSPVVVPVSPRRGPAESAGPAETPAESAVGSTPTWP